MPTKGRIIYRNRSKQVYDFAGLQRHNNITPTDIDGVIDYLGRAFVYLEGKVNGTKIKNGQRWALQNIINSHHKAGHPAILFFFYHQVNIMEDVDVASQYLKNIYSPVKVDGLCGKLCKEGWYLPDCPFYSILDAINIFEQYFGIK